MVPGFLSASFKHFGDKKRTKWRGYNGCLGGEENGRENKAKS